jgi:hypothetical protein
MTMDFNEIANELIQKIKTDRFNANNQSHMDAAKEILSKYIKDENLLSYMIFALKFPDTDD